MGTLLMVYRKDLLPHLREPSLEGFGQCSKPGLALPKPEDSFRSSLPLLDETWSQKRISTELGYKRGAQTP